MKKLIDLKAKYQQETGSAYAPPAQPRDAKPKEKKDKPKPQKKEPKEQVKCMKIV